jgi:tetratricopeptide (TPR) repeat protein
LPVLAAVAVLLAAAYALPAQEPAPVPGHAPNQPSTETPSQASPAAPQLSDATPEQIGDALALRQRYEAAIAAYGKETHPTYTLWNRMGMAYQMMYDTSNAIRCYKNSLGLNPKNANVYNNLATAYDSMKQYGMGERMYRKALKLDPQSALVMKNLGTNLLAQHKYKKGWAVYQQALAIDPKIFENSSGVRVQNPASLRERGAMNYYTARGCASTGRTECALQYLRMALDEGFTNPKKIAADKAFEPLGANPAFQQLMAAQPKH